MKFSLFLVLTFAVGSACAADAPVLDESMCLQGTVLETIDVDAYTYLRLRTAGGETWAAIDRASVPTGKQVAIAHAAVMKDFWSRMQQKTYEWIVFGGLAESCEPPAHADGGMAAHHAAMSAATAPAAGSERINVAMADGPRGRTVAEVITGSSVLDNKPVSVRGRVVGYTPDVMGRNWIHLRDGSGSAADGSNDILVATAAQAQVGDTVLVKGVVHTNRDFGAGYVYKVLIEDATLER